MQLDSIMTVNVGNNTLELNNLDILLIDHPSQKRVMVKVHPAARPLLLWRGTEYDEAGDYTQAQVESRILEVLGEDLQVGLQNLFNIEIL